MNCTYQVTITFLQVVETLLRKGASVRSKDRAGRTSIDIASVSQKIWPYFQELKCEKLVLLLFMLLLDIYVLGYLLLS